MHEGTEVLPGAWIDDYGCLSLCPRCGLRKMQVAYTEEAVRTWVSEVCKMLQEIGISMPDSWNEDEAVQSYLEEEFYE